MNEADCAYDYDWAVIAFFPWELLFNVLATSTLPFTSEIAWHFKQSKIIK
jgi:hypothetical protein